MQPRDADATKARLIAAATEEFAQHGIAGARVDRIATAAQSNKAQIYHYFGSKDGLFAAVMGCHAEEMIASDYFDITDLPETAARIHDQFQANPHLDRLITWYRLEGSTSEFTQVEEANRRKIAAIEKAQHDGTITDRLPAEVLLELIVTIATAGDMPGDTQHATRDHDPAQRRRYVIEAVRRLVAP